MHLGVFGPVWEPRGGWTTMLAVGCAYALKCNAKFCRREFCGDARWMRVSFTEHELRAPKLCDLVMVRIFLPIHPQSIGTNLRICEERRLWKAGEQIPNNDCCIYSVVQRSRRKNRSGCGPVLFECLSTRLRNRWPYVFHLVIDRGEGNRARNEPVHGFGRT